ncbi:MAG: hypothetical protein ABIQ44_08640, partial [Chloroflexia bacterium]
GTIEGTQTVTPLGGDFISVVFTATGQSTRLGRLTASAPHIVNVTTGIGVGSFQMTASNGDTLTMNLTGVGVFVSPTIAQIHENLSITGGTGRFSGATGLIQVTRTFDFATAISTGTFEGVLVLAK